MGGSEAGQEQNQSHIPSDSRVKAVNDLGDERRAYPVVASYLAMGSMRLLVLMPPPAPLPRRSEVEAFWNFLSAVGDRTISQSVPAFLLQTPGGDPAARRKALNERRV